MTYVWQRWMADEFRAAGLTVIETDGWENRGRPASTGHYDPDEGVTNHHTASTTSPSNPAPTIRLLIVGRPDLPGPLAPWSVDYLGRVWIIAAGRCNHAGRVGKPVPGAYVGADGNAIFMGDEIDTNGTQTMPPAQRHAVAVTNAVYLRHFGHDPERVHRHQDISDTGKWDLGSLTTTQLRADAAEASTQEDQMTPDQERKLNQAAEDAAAAKKLSGQAVRMLDRQRRRQLDQTGRVRSDLAKLREKDTVTPDDLEHLETQVAELTRLFTETDDQED